MNATMGIEYRPPGPIAASFLRSDAFVCGIRGPIGSGKSTACVMKLLRHALQPRVIPALRNSQHTTHQRHWNLRP